jgi:spore coat polysaccharide biosynthesis predicted glycosyltransferase SpsG
MKRIFRIDANREIGYGHAVRTAALAAALPPGDTIVCGEVEQHPAFFPGARLIDAPSTATECMQVMAELRPDVIVCDSPLLDAGFWNSADTATCPPLVAIDDYGGDVMADLIVNGTVLPQYHHYPLLRASARACCGAQYALLRPEFSSANHWADPAEARLAIVVGSGRRAASWLQTLFEDGLLKERTFKVSVVVGWGFSEPELLGRMRRSGIQVDQGLAASDLASLLCSSSALLCTGGMIVYEALALGVPAIVFPQEENLVEEAAWFAARGGILDLGTVAGGSGDMVRRAVIALMKDSARRSELSRVARSLIDGAGIARAAKEIVGLVERGAR